jgi:hypothetical protein
MASTLERIFGLVRGIAGTLLRPGGTAAPGKSTTPAASRPARSAPPARPGTGTRGAPAPGRRAPSSPGTGLSAPYPGDFHGHAKVTYSPKPDGRPDPGEIVWTWVPFEEDFRQGKDRPVLLVGRASTRLLGVMLTSKDHADDHRGDNDYLEIGAGPWDRQGRPSEVKLDRILQIDERDVRREGSVLDAKRFSLVADGLRRRHGWG